MNNDLNLTCAAQAADADKQQSLPASSDATSGPRTGDSQCSAGGRAWPRRWRLAFDCAVVGGLSAILALWHWNKAYTAVSLLQISAAQQAIVFQTEDRSQNSFEIYKGTQQQLLTSDVVLTSALRKPEAARSPVIQKEADPVRWLANNLRVEYPGNAEVMRVSLTGTNSDEAALLVRAVVEAYMNGAGDADRREKRDHLAELDKLYNEKSNLLRSKRMEMKQLEETLKTGDPGTLNVKQQMAMQEYAEARNDWNRLRSELERAKSDLELKKRIGTPDKKDLAPETAELKARIDILTAQEKAASADRDAKREMAEKFGNSSIDVEMMRSELMELEAILKPIAEKRDKLSVELGSMPRINVFQSTEAPMSPDIVLALPEINPRLRQLLLNVLAVLAAALIPACLALCRTGRERMLLVLMLLIVAVPAGIFLCPFPGIAFPVAAGVAIFWGVCDAAFVGLRH